MIQILVSAVAAKTLGSEIFKILSNCSIAFGRMTEGFLSPVSLYIERTMDAGATVVLLLVFA